MVLLALMLCSVGAYGKSIPFKRLSSDDGLSQATIYSILQDRRGFVWLGTLEGLNRYDGSKFLVFSHDEDQPGSLSHDWVRTVVQDHGGVIWVGTDGGGLNRFNESTGTFSHLRHDPADPTTLSSDRVRALLVSASGSIWVGTDGGGLNLLDPATGSISSFSHDPSKSTSLSGDRVSSLLEDRAGAIWVGTDGAGLNRLDPATGVFTRFQNDPRDPTSLSSDRVRTISEDAAGRLWVGTYDGGLNRLDPVRGTFSRFRHDPGDPWSLSNDRVRAVLEDETGRLWVGTDAGLNELLPGGTFRSHRNDPANANSLSDDRVTALHLDRGGVLWVGTYAGVNTWNSVAGTLSHFSADSSDPVSLGHRNVMALHGGSSGVVWVGTWGGGLDRVDRRRREVVHFRHRPGDPASLSDDRVMSLLEDSAGVLWAGTVAGGLNRLEPGRRSFRRFVHDPADDGSLSANGVTSILEGHEGSLWIGTYRGGLNSFDRSTERFTRYRHDPASVNSLSNDRVIALHQDRAGILWIGTEGGGLNRLDPATGRFSSYRHDPENPSSLSSDTVFAVLEDERGDLWVGTQTGGLNRWRAADRRSFRPVFERYTKKDGLQSNLIYGILEDRDGHLWLSSNRGLSRFDPQTGSFRHYDRSYGLQDHEFNGGAYHQSPSGEMFFGGPNGFNAFFPDQLRGNSHVPPVEITGFLKFNKPFDLGAPVWQLDQLELGYRDSVVAFDFAALDFTAPAKNRYLHKLEGFDQDWVESVEIRRATYTNLDPGEYVFRVKASNNEGVWNEEGASLKVVVAPPPWASWWALGIYGLAIAAALLAFARAQAKKRARAAELERTNENLEGQIRERRRAERALSKLSKAVEQSPASVMITDPDGRIEYVNPRFEEITGYEAADVIGRRPSILESGYTDSDRHAEIWRTVRAGGEWRGELHSRRKNGELYWEYASVSPIRSADGTVTHILAANEDITMRKEYEEKLLHQQHFDGLTGLPNRTLAFDRLSRAVVQRRHDADVVVVICVDLDNFKIVNETLGHAAGDRLLVESAERLVATVGSAPTVARQAGDEFLIILPNLPSAVEAEVVATKIRDAMSRPFDLDGRDVFVSASLGITASPADGDDPHVLLRNADAAMHMAKKQGRGSYRFFTPAMNDQVRRRLGLESGLRRALSDGEGLSVAYQPIIEVASGRIAGVEALLRWNSEELGAVHPEEAITVAEETGTIVEVGRWVLDTACRQTQAWRTETGLPLRLAVNVSSRQFTSCDPVQLVERALRDSGLPAESLELELTESLLLKDSDEILTTLRSLSDLGVQLALDDFGTGYSALSYLKKYRFDTLKIDRAFIAGVVEEEDQAALVSAIMAMGHSLCLEVVAEGVETEEQFRFLQGAGCDYVQGFHFWRPQSPEKLLELLREQAGPIPDRLAPVEPFPASA